jgi:hypothetical protein
MSQTTARKQARRRARIDKRTDRSLRAFEHALAEAITRLPRSPRPEAAADVADALRDGRSLDTVPTAQRDATEATIAEFERLDDTLTARGWQFCGQDSGPDALTWHYLPSRHDPSSPAIEATTTITVVNHTAATVRASDVELVPAGCSWINGYWSTAVAILLANLDQVETHTAGDDPNSLPFHACGQYAKG